MRRIRVGILTVLLYTLLMFGDWSLANWAVFLCPEIIELFAIPEQGMLMINGNVWVA